MTPQSELTRLLGIPPELWEGELKGMSHGMLVDLFQETTNALLVNDIDRELTRRRKDKESQP